MNLTWNVVHKLSTGLSTDLSTYIVGNYGHGPEW